MSGSFEQLDVPPTLVSFALSMTKASRTLSALVKEAGRTLCLLPIPEDRDGMPAWDKLKDFYRAVLLHTEVRGTSPQPAWCGEGGAAAPCCACASGEKLGLPLWGRGFPKRPCSLPRRAPWWWPSPRRRTLPLTRP